jgi:hypothetical protein
MMEFYRARFWVKVAHAAYHAGWNNTAKFAITRAQRILARDIEERYPIMRSFVGERK